MGFQNFNHNLSFKTSRLYEKEISMSKFMNKVLGLVTPPEKHVRTIVTA